MDALEEEDESVMARSDVSYGLKKGYHAKPP